MTDSFHTDPPSRIAARRKAQGVRGRPRIVERKPFPGDRHPMEKAWLSSALELIPEEYLYGLRTIEMRPRKGDVGNPFGLYRPPEKAIYLYSLPMRWELDTVSGWLKESLEWCSVEVKSGPSGFTIIWPSAVSLAIWFFNQVVTHELGHHYDFQYRHRRPVTVGLRYKEAFADLQSARLNDAWFEALFEKKREAADDS